MTDLVKLDEPVSWRDQIKQTGPDINAAQDPTRVPDVPLTSAARAAIASRRPAPMTADDQLALAAEAQKQSMESARIANKARDELLNLARTVQSLAQAVSTGQLALDAATSSIAAGLVKTGEDVWLLLRAEREDDGELARWDVVGVFGSRDGAERAAGTWRPNKGDFAWGRAYLRDPLDRGGDGERWEAECRGPKNGGVLALERRAVTR